MATNDGMTTTFCPEFWNRWELSKTMDQMQKYPYLQYSLSYAYHTQEIVLIHELLHLWRGPVLVAKPPLEDKVYTLAGEPQAVYGPGGARLLALSQRTEDACGNSKKTPIFLRRLVGLTSTSRKDDNFVSYMMAAMQSQIFSM